MSDSSRYNCQLMHLWYKTGYTHRIIYYKKIFNRIQLTYKQTGDIRLRVRKGRVLITLLPSQSLRLVRKLNILFLALFYVRDNRMWRPSKQTASILDDILLLRNAGNRKRNENRNVSRKSNWRTTNLEILWVFTNDLPFDGVRRYNVIILLILVKLNANKTTVIS